MKLNVIEPVRDEGTIILFRGEDDEGNRVVFAADHRPAEAIIGALFQGEDVVVDVEDWQVVGTAEPIQE